MKASAILNLIGDNSTQPLWCDNDIDIADVSVSTYHQVRCYPTDIRKPNNVIPYGFYDNKGGPITQTNHKRGHQKNDFIFIDNPQKDSDVDQRLQGKSLYLGWLFAHYGHYLTESLSRLWAINEVDINSYDYLLFNYKQQKKDDIVNAEFIWKIFEKLGINKQKVVLINESYIIDELHVPSQALVLRARISTLMPNVWRKISKPSSHPELKVYISRSEIPRRKLHNEEELQDALSAKGFQIIAPQKMDIEDQLKIYADTKLLVSPAGTGLHNAVFMPKNSRVISITNPDFFLINELLCCYASGINYNAYQTNPVQAGEQWLIDVEDFMAYF